MEDMMIDIETLGTRPGSVILSVGAVMFDRHGVGHGETFYMNVERESRQGRQTALIGRIP